jgi:hypothetical protein
MLLNNIDSQLSDLPPELRKKLREQTVKQRVYAS